MLDTGLLLSGAAIVAVVLVATRAAPTGYVPRTEAADRLLWPAFAGLVVARLAAAAIDDPTSIRSVRSLMVIRGGVEFWPGVLALVLLVGWGAHRRREDAWVVLCDLAPLALWGYAAYEFSCLLRGDCYGPSSPVGVVPEGLHDRMVPIGLFVGVGVAIVGALVRHVWQWSPARRVLLAIVGVAGMRSLAGFWLPHLGDGPTRQHLESLVVFLVASVAALVLWFRRRPSSAAGAPAPDSWSPAEGS